MASRQTPATYFVTSATSNRRRLFQSPANAHLLLETLQHYRREGHYHLHAFVAIGRGTALAVPSHLRRIERL